MVTLSRGAVQVDRALKAPVKAPRMPRRLLLRQQHARRWSMDCDRSKSLSRVPALAAKRPFVLCKMQDCPSPQLSMSHLFRTMAADRRNGGVYRWVTHAVRVRRIQLDGTLYRPRLQAVQT